jgi:hypothetical protein
MMRMVWASLAVERDYMRPFRLIPLVTGTALSVSVAPFAGHPVLADAIETVAVETGNGGSVCPPDDTAIGLKPSAMNEAEKLSEIALAPLGSTLRGPRR